MKGKHLHAFCLFVCVGRLLFSILMFPGLDPVLNIHFVLLRVRRRVINGATAAVLFSSSQSLITDNYPLVLILSARSPEIQRGCPLSAGERKPSFLDEVCLVAGPAGKFHLSHRVSQCAVKGLVL